MISTPWSSLLAVEAFGLGTILHPPQGNAALAPAACARVTFGAPLPTRTMASATTARTSFDLKKPFMNVSPNYLKYTTTKSPEKEVP